MNEEWLGGISGGLQGLNQWLMQMVMQKQREKDIAREDERRAGQDAERREATDLSLAMSGVRRGTAPTTSPLPSSLEPFGASLAAGAGWGTSPRPQPGFTQLTPGFYQEEAQTPEGRAAALDEIRRRARRGNLIRAGVPETQVDAALDNPSLADNFLPQQRQPSEVNWQLVEGEDGYYQVNPRTGERRRIDGVRHPPRSEGSFVQMADETGKPVFFSPSQGSTVQPPQNLRSIGGAGADYTSRVQAVANAETALNRLERTLEDTGSAVMPSVGKSLLESDYENYQLQLKELYRLGVLAGPDLMLMRRILNDPTSFSGRVEAFGSGDRQKAKVLAQIEAARGRLADFRKNLSAGNQALAGTPDSKPSLAERVQQLKAEGKTKEQAKAILRSEGYEVP